MTDLLSDAEKATFKRATERRRENGIRLKQLRIDCEAKQVEAFNIIWSSWVEKFGKTRSMDGLIRLMSTANALVMDQERAKEKKRANHRPGS